MAHGRQGPQAASDLNILLTSGCVGNSGDNQMFDRELDLNKATSTG